jgi:hypothetical protein
MYCAQTRKFGRLGLWRSKKPINKMKFVSSFSLVSCLASVSFAKEAQANNKQTDQSSSLFDLLKSAHESLAKVEASLEEAKVS